MKIIRFALAALALLSTSSTAWAATDGEVAAYQQGFNAGVAACQADPQCGHGPGGVGGFRWIGDGSPGSSSAYQLPPDLFGPGGTSNDIVIPQNWWVTPMQGGQGIVGKVQADGSFSPYVFDPSGEFKLLPDEERPVWAVDPQYKALIGSLPKQGNGLTFVPVQPSQMVEMGGNN